MSRAGTPPRDQVGPNDPLRLAIAAALAYPDGSMTAAGLRRENSRGRLVIERAAGKDYTTLADIERMRELCRVAPKARACGSGQPDETQPGASRISQPCSSSIEAAKSRLDALLTTPRRQNRRSQTTSRKSIARPAACETLPRSR